MANLSSKVIIFLVFTFAQPSLIDCVNSSDHLIDQPHDPYKDMCSSEYHQGEYFRETGMKIVCCGNETLRSPDILVQEQRFNPAYAECAQKFKSDDKSDFPTGMWTAFICKLQKAKVFKTNNQLSFEELRTFMTQLYPENVKNELKTATVKCKAIDSEKVADHLKIQKYMECYYEAENKTCHKPYAEIDYHVEDVKKTKDLGCPVIPGLLYASSIEYCCKKRSTPYPIMDFPGPLLSEKAWNAIDQCTDSFEKREKELKPEVFQVVTPKTDDGEDHQMHSTWHNLCFSACVVYQKNYTKSMLKLEPDTVIDFYTHDFGKAMSDDLSTIIKRRKNKNKIFLAMDVDAGKSQPMNFPELSAKFDKASEKEQIQYFCKFVDTINVEERRAVHEYCIGEKYGNEWGDAHHSLFVPVL